MKLSFLTILSLLISIRTLYNTIFFYYFMAQDPQQPQYPNTPQDPNQPNNYNSPSQSFYPPEQNPYLQANTQSAPQIDSYEQPQFDSYQPATDYTQNTNFAAPQASQYPDQNSFTPDFNNPMMSPATSISPENMLPQQGLASEEVPNTFETKNSNRLVLVLGVILVIGLLIATGILVYLNFFRNQTSTPTNTATTTNSQTQQTNNTSTPNSETVTTPDNKLTGGDNSPATLSRKNSATTPSKDWLKAKFVQPDVDKDGNCLVQTKCGDTADYDNDGLTTVEEYNFDTDPLVSDTDSDGISDGNEIYVYYTNPLKIDSDGDTFKDSSEITNCYDPILTPTTPPSKMLQDRLTQISDSVALKPLKDDTIKTLKAAGAVSTDLTKGYIAAKCLPVAPKSN